jgi:hypothetical protein
VQIGWGRRREGSGVNRTCRHRVPSCALAGRGYRRRIRGRCCSAEDSPKENVPDFIIIDLGAAGSMPPWLEEEALGITRGHA